MLVLLFVFLAGCATATGSEGGPDTLAYACDDVVVVGRVTALPYEDASAPGDLLGHAAWDLRIKIKQVVHGAESKRVVPAIGVSHAQIRDDTDMLIVLSRQQQGYVVRTLSVLEGGRPRLEPTCTPAA